MDPEVPMATEATTPGLHGSPTAVGGRRRCPCCGAVVLTPRGDRRFTLIDAMILVAASAVAFVIVRPIITGPLRDQPRWAGYLAAVMGVLVTWTPTVLALRLRRPRPRFRRLSRQPGFAAGLAGTSIVALGILAVGLLALVRVARRGMAVRAGMRLRPPDPSWWLGVVLHFGAVVGPAVIGAWLLLTLSGRRRPSGGWLDLLGRGLGVAWIILFVINGCARLSYLRD